MLNPFIHSKIQLKMDISRKSFSPNSNSREKFHLMFKQRPLKNSKIHKRFRFVKNTVAPKPCSKN